MKNELLTRIISEGIVFMQIPSIMKDPVKQIDYLLKEQEHGFA